MNVYISIQNAKMFEGEDNDEDIHRHAQEWIEQNREQIEQWLTEAKEAAQ
ncbi:MAG: hypothetical protein GY801_45275 [bacterium]|nr:hypothetical protein [bacterium]